MSKISGKTEPYPNVCANCRCAAVIDINADLYLKSCPFCGSPGTLHTEKGPSWLDGVSAFVDCEDCGMASTPHYVATEDVAIAEATRSWNTRQERTCRNLQRDIWGSDYDDDAGFTCSECGYDDDVCGETKYCPECGAKLMSA